MSAPYPLIPYGWADFRAIRLEGRLYVDKTRFIRPLENERFTYPDPPPALRQVLLGVPAGELLRPQLGRRVRAGSSAAPTLAATPLKSAMVMFVLRFDFSAVNDVPETLEQEFEYYCNMELRGALKAQ